MADLSLNWEDVAGGDDLSGGTTVDTGGIEVTVGFDAAAGADATIGTEDEDQYVAPGEDFDDDSSLALYGWGNDGGPGKTSTTTLDFTATDSAYADTVTDVSFRINDLDRGNSHDDHVDIVTVTAFDADGNEIDVNFTPEGNQTVSGNTVTGGDVDDGDVDADDKAGSVLVNIAGPVSEIRIEYANGEETDQKISLTDVHFQTMDAADPDGYVEGTNGDDHIDAAYTGDPDGDMIDAGDAVLSGEGPDDDIVLAGDGDDTVLSGEGADEVYAGGGSDSVEGGAGDDVIHGDGDLDGAGGGGETTRESFNWSGLDDPDYHDFNHHIDDGDDLDGMTLTQDTGTVTVTATLESSDTSRVDSEHDTAYINVDGIDGGDETVNDRSSLRSYDNNGNGDATYSFDFSEAVTNAQFTVSDIDGNLGQVSVRAYDADGNMIPVSLTGGQDLNLSDEDSVAGDETATGTDNGSPTDGDNALLVDIAGPVTRIEVDHVNVGDGSSQVNISDIFFDAAGDDLGGGDAGNDTLSGGDGNDAIFGQGGDDLIDGGAGNDTVEGGTGDDTISGDAPVTPVSITIDASHAGFENEVFAYTIDPDTGDISNIQTLTDNAHESIGETFGYDAAPGAVVGVGIVSPEGTFYSSGHGDNVDLNSDGVEHTQGRGQGPDGQVTLGFEDRYELGDSDFDDVVVTIDLGTSGTSLDNAHYAYDSDTPEAVDDGDDLLSGGIGDDLIYGLGGNDTITGGDGSDTVHGGSGNDVIDTSAPASSDPLPDRGYPGLFPADSDPENDRDSVTGGAGDDIITTGDDDDTISGGTGNDYIDAGFDDDLVSGDAGADTIVGGEGSDTISGGSGDDLIYGGLDPSFPDSLNIPDDNTSGPDDEVTDNGRDLIDGGDGNDTIFGQDDDDTIYGGAGDDSIDAGIDDDLVFGGTGDDTITGGQGADTLSGGDDRDTFVGANPGDDIDGGGGGDDYDTLDLTGSAPTGGSLNVIYDASNPENGTVDFFDSDGVLLGTAAFEEIENVIPCFTPGSLIATPKGERPVEELQVGDRVITRDNGLQEIRWIGAKTINGVEMARNPVLKPVLVRRGALGNGLPERDMMVSPNHRVLIANERAALYFDEREVLAAAKHLVGMDGVHEVDAMATTYIHFMFDHHEVVLSDGAWTESFQPGDMSLRGIGGDQRSEIFALFPELESEAGIRDYRAARRSLKKHEAQLLVK
jgi:Ca2+-binding RTX toxin-like protein